MAAYYNGLDLGFIFEMSTSVNPKGRQINAYPGADGLEVIDQGSRGGVTFVSAAIVASSAQALGAAEQQLRSLQVNGGAYVLRDDLGKYWPGVILIQHRPIGRVYPVVTGLLTYFARRYQCEFLHVF